jgi:eukaryotic-like serine/threonine-protein kinase
VTTDPGVALATELGTLPSRAPASAQVPIRNDYASEIAESAGVPLTISLGPGTKIRQYELIRELSRGGMGVVYAARDLRLGRKVAMKFLRHADRDVVERFLVEARATARCNHESIVIIHEVDEYQSTPYMVLEYLEGRTLRELMGPFGDGVPMPAPRVVELMVPVARALVRAHQLGIVHRAVHRILR